MMKMSVNRKWKIKVVDKDMVPWECAFSCATVSDCPSSQNILTILIIHTIENIHTIHNIQITL